MAWQHIWKVLYILSIGWDWWYVLWNGDEEDGNVRNVCENEGTDFADGDTDTEWKM